MNTVKSKVLVVDDEPDIRQLIGQILEDFDYRVTEVHDADAARRAVRFEKFDAILLDIWMPGDDGITLLQEWYEAKLPTPVIMLSAHGTVETAVAATKFGAYDYLEKPVSAGRLEITVRNAVNQGIRVGDDSHAIEARFSKAEIIGSSTKISGLRNQIRNATKTNANVLIVGEPGSGRETTARVIHQSSADDERPLIVVDWLTSDNSTQPVSELVEEAANGTLLFLDLQAYDSHDQNRVLGLLHAISNLSSKQKNSSPRLIATSTIAIHKLLQSGEFRPEVFLRISELTIQIPALREHAEDVPELVGYYTDYLNQTENLKYRSYSTAALNRMRNHPWHGNVSELINVLRQIMVSDCAEIVAGPEIQPFLSEMEFVEKAALSKTSGSRRLYKLPYKAAKEIFERDYLLYHLKNSPSYTEIAKKTGLHRSSLFRKIRDHEIQILPGGESSLTAKKSDEP